MLVFTQQAMPIYDLVSFDYSVKLPIASKSMFKKDQSNSFYARSV